MQQIFTQLDPVIQLDCAGNGHDMLCYLAGCTAEDLPLLIIFDPAIPFIGQAPLISILTCELRLSHIPIVIWTDQPGNDYYTARRSGRVVMSFVKPSRPGSWRLLAQKMLAAVEMEQRSADFNQ